MADRGPGPAPARRRRVHAPLPPARAAARLAQSALLRPVASQSSRRCRPAATDAADAGTAANRAVAGDGGAAGARRGGGGPRDAGRTQDLPALSPRAVDLHPHAATESGHGTVIRTLLPPVLDPAFACRGTPQGVAVPTIANGRHRGPDDANHYPDRAAPNRHLASERIRSQSVGGDLRSRHRAPKVKSP